MQEEVTSKTVDLQRNAQHQQEAATPDTFMTGERITTPRGSFHVTGMTREQMEVAGYGYHHSSEDGKYLIMGNGTQAYACYGISFLATTPVDTLHFSKPIRKSTSTIYSKFLKKYGYSYIMYPVRLYPYGGSI